MTAAPAARRSRTPPPAPGGCWTTWPTPTAGSCCSPTATSSASSPPCFLGLPPDTARHLFLGTASLSVLGVEHEWPAILLWNEQEGSGAHTAETGTPGWRGVPA